MKKLIMFLVLLLPVYVFAQGNGNFKFNARKEKAPAVNLVNNLDLKNDAASEAEAAAIEKKGRVKWASNTYHKEDMKINFQRANLLDTVAKNLEKTARDNFKTRMDSLLGTLTISNADDIRNGKMKLTNEHRDELKDIKTIRVLAKEYRYDARSAANFVIFPVGGSTDAQLYFNEEAKDKTASFLNNTLIAFSAGGEKASIYNEIYSDFYGPLRFGFGALVSNKETKVYTDTTGKKLTDSTSLQADAVQRLLGGGGNASVNMSFPIFKLHTNAEDFLMKFTFAPKAGADIPQIGTESSKYAYNLHTGFEGIIYYTGAKNVFTVFSTFRFGIIGGNKTFYQNLQMDNHKPFASHYLSGGIAFKNTFRISYSRFFGDKFVTDNFPNTVSFTIIPN